MGVVTAPSSASRTASTFASRLRSSSAGRSVSVVAFKTDRTNCSATAASTTQFEPITIAPKEDRPIRKPTKKKQPKRENGVDLDLDYNEVAATLENLYKISPCNDNVVRSGNNRKRRRWRRKNREGEIRGDCSLSEEEDDEVEKLVREYSISSVGLASVDWKKMKMPPVLRSSEQGRLFKLMQPMKAKFKVKETLHKNLNKEPTEGELAAAMNMTVPQLRRHIEVGRAARNKLIKHNLRLVLFAINKYYQEIASGNKFQDLCQAGVKGLITAIDRFEPKRGFRLSTYGLFWIRHSITRSMTSSSFTRVPFGIESVRQEILDAKLELMFELQRLPTEEEIIARVGISPKRYHDVMRASKSVYSLNSRHAITQEEFINGITDVDGVASNMPRQPSLLRLALDDVLDSLKPKESLVVRQRYGLDGKGDRTLGEIAGNLNISREMVQKHELKALMKLRHPARLDYLRRYI